MIDIVFSIKPNIKFIQSDNCCVLNIRHRLLIAHLHEHNVYDAKRALLSNLLTRCMQNMVFCVTIRHMIITLHCSSISLERCYSSRLPPVDKIKRLKWNLLRYGNSIVCHLNEGNHFGGNHRRYCLGDGFIGVRNIKNRLVVVISFERHRFQHLLNISTWALE